MAVIIFSGLIESICGSLNGSVIKRTKSGFAIQSKGYPRLVNRSEFQINKALFAYYARSWRALSCASKAQWISEASTGRWGYYADGVTPLSGQDAFMKLHLLYSMYAKNNESHPFTVLSNPGASSMPSFLEVFALNLTIGVDTLDITTDALQLFLPDDIVIFSFSECNPCSSYFNQGKLYYGISGPLQSAQVYTIPASQISSKKVTPVAGWSMSVTGIIVNMVTGMISVPQSYSFVIS